MTGAGDAQATRLGFRLALGAAVVLFALGAARDGLSAWIDRTPLPDLIVETGVEVLDRDGRLLRPFTVADGRWRLSVSSDGVDPLYLAMLLAHEDKRFASHPGVDARAILRAAGQAVWNGRVVSGGSTLTMQVARLLEDSGTGRWQGKLRQARLALALERRLSKVRILDLYLHLAPFGGNLEGLRAASLAWFGKGPRRLTPAQAALLVALPQSPEARRPDRDAAAARRARDVVLDRMVRRGVLTAEAAAAARAESVPTVRRDFPMLAPHLAERLRREDPLSHRFVTTLDADLQAALESLATKAVRGRGERLQIALMVADHATGAVLASVGSADYAADRREGFVDMTRARRSPGSTLKPLIYGLAFDEGLAHPETLIEDRPTDFGGYVPQNFDGRFRGTLRVADALQQSLNIPTVALLQRLGPARLMSALRQSGAHPVVPGGVPGLAIGLGGIGLTLEEMTGLYAGLAQGGQVRRLRYVQGAPVPADRRAILGRAAAWQVADVLAGVTPPPNAPRGRLPFKTGTSYGYRDAWALGWDGRLVAGVWMGRADGTPVPGAFGADQAAPILFEALSRAGPRSPLPPPPPETLIVTNAALPQPLQRFGGAVGGNAGLPDPSIAFPPNGAVVRVEGALIARVSDGKPPFTWLANGRPVIRGSRDRQASIADTGAGFLELAVIDANGRAARVSLRLDPVATP